MGRCREDHRRKPLAVAWIFSVSLSIMAIMALSTHVMAENPYADLPRISAFKAKKLFDEGKLILVDTNTLEARRRRGTFLGALAITLEEMQTSHMKLPEDVIVAFTCE